MFRENDSRRAPTFDDQPAKRARLRSLTDADKDLYTHAGYDPVTCNHCGACVRVRKNSPPHTSIQWTGDSAAACPVMSGWRDGTVDRGDDDTCPRMQASIAYAYAEGLITLHPSVDPATTEDLAGSTPTANETNRP